MCQSLGGLAQVAKTRTLSHEWVESCVSMIRVGPLCRASPKQIVELRLRLGTQVRNLLRTWSTDACYGRRSALLSQTGSLQVNSPARRDRAGCTAASVRTFEERKNKLPRMRRRNQQ
jgi:hypothetical protein